MGNARCVLVCLERSKVSIGARVEADHGKVDAIIGAENLTVAFSGRSESYSGGSNRQGVEKLTSCNQFISPSDQQRFEQFS
jgi:hypothetical protein